MEKQQNKRHGTRLYAPLARSTFLPLDLLVVPQLWAHLDQGDARSWVPQTSRQSRYTMRIASHVVTGITKGYCGRNYFLSGSAFRFYSCSLLIWPGFPKLGLFFYTINFFSPPFFKPKRIKGCLVCHHFTSVILDRKQDTE